MVEYRTRRLVVAFAGAASLAFGGLANAQTSNAGAAALARANNLSVMSSYQARNASGAAVSTDGAIEAGEDQSGFSNAGVGGVFDTLSGVGATGGAGTFGGALNVVTQAGAPGNVPGNASGNVSGNVQNNQTNTGGGGATASPIGGVFNADSSSQQR